MKILKKEVGENDKFTHLQNESKTGVFVGRHFQIYDTSPKIPYWPWA